MMLAMCKYKVVQIELNFFFPKILATEVTHEHEKLILMIIYICLNLGYLAIYTPTMMDAGNFNDPHNQSSRYVGVTGRGWTGEVSIAHVVRKKKYASRSGEPRLYSMGNGKPWKYFSQGGR